jgi:hypothetical protein
MKALSLTQPWATLVAIGAKRIETRSWRPHYRGPIAIHASKAFPRECQNLCSTHPFLDVLIAAGLNGSWDLPLGAIIATARLHATLQTREIRCYRSTTARLLPHELAFGDYSDGRYGFVMADVRPLKHPVPCKGALGFWDVPADVEHLLLEGA